MEQEFFLFKFFSCMLLLAAVSTDDSSSEEKSSLFPLIRSPLLPVVAQHNVDFIPIYHPHSGWSSVKQQVGFEEEDEDSDSQVEITENVPDVHHSYAVARLKAARSGSDSSSSSSSSSDSSSGSSEEKKPKAQSGLPILVQQLKGHLLPQKILPKYPVLQKTTKTSYYKSKNYGTGTTEPPALETIEKPTASPKIKSELNSGTKKEQALETISIEKDELRDAKDEKGAKCCDEGKSIFAGKVDEKIEKKEKTDVQILPDYKHGYKFEDPKYRFGEKGHYMGREQQNSDSLPFCCDKYPNQQQRFYNFPYRPDVIKPQYGSYPGFGVGHVS